MLLKLTSQASLDEYVTRIDHKLEEHNTELEKQSESSMPHDIESDIKTLTNIRTLLNIDRREPKKNMYVSLDLNELYLIYREYREEDYE